VGKLKMALELGVREVDPLCLQLQQMIRQVRMTDKLRNRIDAEIAKHLSGVSAFVIRSSSNAEDLAGFSAAGIYESISSVSKADKIFESVKEVWASLLSPRSVRLRHQVGISLDDCYMGVIIQEMIQSDIGGVLVTTNPSNPTDFRNVYMNVSLKSVEKVVAGSVLPIQMIYNTVEGGGRTLSLGDFAEGISKDQSALLQSLAFIGRLLQSHFSPDYTFSQPVDIEWLAGESGIGLLQIRPYSE
jgi:phosphoenolpyruvate synthase/pyruvate phosphate dikinase